MPRPKGSKNKVTRARAPRKATIPTIDLASLIADKSTARDLLAAEIASLEENLTSIKVDLKAKKAELKKLDTELGNLEAQKAEIRRFPRRYGCIRLPGLLLRLSLVRPASLGRKPRSGIAPLSAAVLWLARTAS